jgi:hypothetical protein
MNKKLLIINIFCAINNICSEKAIKKLKENIKLFYCDLSDFIEKGKFNFAYSHINVYLKNKIIPEEKIQNIVKILLKNIYIQHNVNLFDLNLFYSLLLKNNIIKKKEIILPYTTECCIAEFNNQIKNHLKYIKNINNKATQEKNNLLKYFNITHI